MLACQRLVRCVRVVRPKKIVACIIRVTVAVVCGRILVATRLGQNTARQQDIDRTPPGRVSSLFRRLSFVHERKASDATRRVAIQAYPHPARDDGPLCKRRTADAACKPLASAAVRVRASRVCSRVRRPPHSGGESNGRCSIRSRCRCEQAALRLNDVGCAPRRHECLTQDYNY